MMSTLLVALSCFPLYEQIVQHEVRFEQGAARLDAVELERLSDVVSPVAGNPLAEVRFRAAFEFAEADLARPTYRLANERLDNLEAAAASFGVHGDLVGLRSSAIGMTWVGYDMVRTPFDARDLDTVSIDVRVKSGCHPLADASLQLNPY